MMPDHDVVIVNLTAIDRSSHFYWQELELGPEAELDSTILAAYQVADAVIGDVLGAADDQTTVLAFSEIGFGPVRAYRSINEVLAKAGLAKMGEAGRPDWGRSQAFEAVQGTHGINLNVQNRYKDGTVAPIDYHAVSADVSAALLAAINPSTGQPYFSDVVPREDVYTGERSRRRRTSSWSRPTGIIISHSVTRSGPRTSTVTGRAAGTDESRIGPQPVPAFQPAPLRVGGRAGRRLGHDRRACWPGQARRMERAVPAHARRPDGVVGPAPIG